MNNAAKKFTHNSQHFKNTKRFHSKTFRKNIEKGKKVSMDNIAKNLTQEAARRKKSGLPRMK